LLNFNDSFNYLNINENKEYLDFLKAKGFLLKIDEKNDFTEIIFTKEIILVMSYR
jgi:hypothetical protein